MNTKPRAKEAGALVLMGALLLTGCTAAPDKGPAGTPFPAADQLMEADRAFAADSRERGVEAWVDVWATDGRLGDAQASSAVGREAVRAVLAPTLAEFGDRFRWQPSEAGMLWPDSLGYTIGRYWIESETGDKPADSGHYLTVWKRVGEDWQVALDLQVPEAAGAPAARDFDFWLGDWNIDQRIRAGADDFETYPAHNKVRSTAIPGVLLESWSGVVRFQWAGMQAPEQIRGASVRVYDPGSGQWRIFWIDTLEYAFGDPFEGAFSTDAPGHGDFLRATPQGGQVRIRFQTRPDGSVGWILASQPPGGEAWLDIWTMSFTRP